MDFEDLPQRVRCATGKVLDRAGNLIYVALADRSPVGGKLAGRRLGHAGCGEALDERLVVDGYGLDRPDTSLSNAATSPWLKDSGPVMS